MLVLDLQIVNDIIDKVTLLNHKRIYQFDTIDDVQITETSSSSEDSRALTSITFLQGEPMLDELKLKIQHLNINEKKSLIALMLIGRGDYPMSKWQEAFQKADGLAVKETTDYLLSCPKLADYLRNALFLHSLYVSHTNHSEYI